MKTWNIGDRVQTKASASERWVDGAVSMLDDGDVYVDSGSMGVVIVSRRQTWPKIQASNRLPPKVRHLPAPPPPIVEPDPYLVEMLRRHTMEKDVAVVMATPRPFLPQPKPLPPDRNLGYLKWVAMQPCCLTGEEGRSEAHHWFGGAKGMGQKVADWHVCPLTPEAHRHWHDHGHLPGMTRAESETLFYRTQARLLAMWLTEAAG